MENDSFLKRLLYKYKYLEQIEKDGVVYKKYKKVNRFRALKKNLGRLVFYTIAILLMLALANILLSLINAPPRRRSVKEQLTTPLANRVLKC